MKEGQKNKSAQGGKKEAVRKSKSSKNTERDYKKCGGRRAENQQLGRKRDRQTNTEEDYNHVMMCLGAGCSDCGSYHGNLRKKGALQVIGALGYTAQKIQLHTHTNSTGRLVGESKTDERLNKLISKGRKYQRGPGLQESNK